MIPLVWKVVVVAVAKKVTVYVLGRVSHYNLIFMFIIITTLQAYGFPRLFRRMSELNRRTIRDRSRRLAIHYKKNCLLSS